MVNVQYRLYASLGRHFFFFFSSPQWKRFRGFAKELQRNDGVKKKIHRQNRHCSATLSINVRNFLFIFSCRVPEASSAVSRSRPKPISKYTYVFQDHPGKIARQLLYIKLNSNRIYHFLNHRYVLV